MVMNIKNQVEINIKTIGEKMINRIYYLILIVIKKIYKFLIQNHPDIEFLFENYSVKDESKKSGNIVQIEIDALNYMRGNIIIDVDKIGNDINEYTYEITPMITEEEKKIRINKLIDAVRFFNGGAKQARNLEDISPKFAVLTKQKTGNPFLLNSIHINDKNELDIKSILEEIKDNKAVLDGVRIGISKNIFKSEDKIKKYVKEENIEIGSITEAFNFLKTGAE